MPTDRQQEFHAATEWDVLYGGAAGGGKTIALLMEGIRACILFPGIIVVAVRESYPQLAESFIAELGRIGFAKALGGSYNKSDHNLSFDNGSVIRFRYCDGLADAQLRLSSEMQLLLVDEATMQDPEAIDFLAMRLRSSNPAIPVLGIRLGSNPGGIGHAWAKTRYVDQTNGGVETYEDVVDECPTGQWVRFVPARYTDNPHVPDYESVLNAVKDPVLRAAYRDGSWDSFAGQVFSEWSRSRHVVATFTPPSSWTRYAGIDWGLDDPHAVEWGAYDDGRLWVYREDYASGVNESDMAADVMRAEGALTHQGTVSRAPSERVRARLADPSMWNKIDEAHPIAETFILAGCVVIKATNDRLAGVARVHSYLAEGPACAIHRGMGWETCPRLHVMDCCPDLIRTLPALPRDKNKPEDVDTHAEDHAYDALRYLVMHLPLPRTTREAKPEAESHQERIAEQLRERSRRRRSSGYVGAF